MRLQIRMSCAVLPSDGRGCALVYVTLRGPVTSDVMTSLLSSLRESLDAHRGREFGILADVRGASPRVRDAVSIVRQMIAFMKERREQMRVHGRGTAILLAESSTGRVLDRVFRLAPPVSAVRLSSWLSVGESVESREDRVAGEVFDWLRARGCRSLSAAEMEGILQSRFVVDDARVDVAQLDGDVDDAFGSS